MSVDILNLDSNFFGMTATGNHIVRGGNATLNVTFNRGNGSVGSNKFKFCIVGENEPVSDVKTTMMPVARQFPNDGWFFGLLPKYESHYLQFNPNGTPNWGGCGVGIGQLDPPPTSDTVWNWKENIEDPWNHLQTDRQPILTRWTTTMNDYNTEKAINPQAVGQPVRDFGSDCPRFFATPFYSSEYNTTSYFDANWMKAYNTGAGQIANAFLNFDNIAKKWVYNQFSYSGGSKFNYVGRACGCEIPPNVCTVD